MKQVFRSNQCSQSPSNEFESVKSFQEVSGGVAHPTKFDPDEVRNAVEVLRMLMRWRDEEEQNYQGEG